MNLDELQSVQARERQSSDLQHLRPSFYREVGEFVERLSEERARAVEAADDPFSSPDVRRLTDDIETAERTVEAVYERRVGKVVKKASIAAAGMPVDDDGLTDEEEELFEDLVARIERNREAVLSATDGEGPSVSCSVDPGGGTGADVDATAGTDAASPADPGRDPSPVESDSSPAGADAADADAADADVSAADLMGTDAASSDGTTTDGPADAAPPVASASASASADPAPGSSDEPSTPSADDPPAPAAAPERAEAGTDTGPGPGADVDPAGGTDNRTTDPADDGGSSIPGLPRTTVRITDEVGEVVGADDRDYDLGAGTVVTLPEPNAEVLVEKDAAERL
ncbi:hypothetical protein BRC88_12140 [Halobacteriales archaeon QS_4_69_225]|nr:MAG: hypothetical protein BRC88_12140 [Halobacteriales archaeon QS_4_69_225]